MSDSTSSSDIQAEMAKLAAELEHHNRLYYVDAEPEISDKEYDELFRKLEELEAEYPLFADPDSPTKRVGGEPIEGFEQIRHPLPMLSIDDLFEISEEDRDAIEKKTGERPPKEKEIVDFYKRLQKGLGTETVPVTIEPKIDGVSAALLYEKGVYFGWQGDVFAAGMTDHHIYRVVDLGHGRTRFEHSDEANGGMAWMLGRTAMKAFERYCTSFNDELKARVEATPVSEAAEGG